MNFIRNKLRWNKQIGAFFMALLVLKLLQSQFRLLRVHNFFRGPEKRQTINFTKPRRRKKTFSNLWQTPEWECFLARRNGKKIFPPLAPVKKNERKEVDCLEVSDFPWNINHIFAIFLDFSKFPRVFRRLFGKRKRRNSLKGLDSVRWVRAIKSQNWNPSDLADCWGSCDAGYVFIRLNKI